MRAKETMKRKVHENIQDNHVSDLKHFDGIIELTGRSKNAYIFVNARTEGEHLIALDSRKYIHTLLKFVACYEILRCFV